MIVFYCVGHDQATQSLATRNLPTPRFMWLTDENCALSRLAGSPDENPGGVHVSRFIWGDELIDLIQYRGGTKFERLGQDGVKDTRCYSLSGVAQRPRKLVGPTAGGKVLDDSVETENERIRRRLLRVR